MRHASPLETLLEIIAATAPEPWYPRRHAEEGGIDPDALGEVLEMAWLEKLVEKSGDGPHTGPGFVLTQLGEKVRHDPEVLQRLREGQPLLENDPGAVVRSSLRLPFRPSVSKLILFANLLVFGYGVSLVWHDWEPMRAFLIGIIGPNANPNVLLNVNRVLHQSGGVQGLDILNGEWWRLLTTCFVHAGLLHLGMNMYMLYNAGAFIEQTWGRARFLVIYALAGWGGSCLAVAYTPNVLVVGASSALCGIFGAEAMWVLLYGRHLPRSIARRARSQIVVNILLLVFISMLPRVSWQAHLGEALAGSAAAFVLHFQRFGPPAARWLVLVALVPIPWISYSVLDRARANNPKWRKLVEFREKHEEERAEREKREEQEKKERDRKERIRKEREERQRKERKERDLGEREYKEFRDRFLDRKKDGYIGRIVEGATKVYEDDVAALLQMHPTRRDAAAVKKALASLPKQQKSATGLAGALDKAGPYKDEATEEARTTARDYARALAELLEMAERCLRAGEKFPGKDERILNTQIKKVEDLRTRWVALIDS